MCDKPLNFTGDNSLIQKKSTKQKIISTVFNDIKELAEGLFKATLFAVGCIFIVTSIVLLFYNHVSSSLTFIVHIGACITVFIILYLWIHSIYIRVKYDNN